MKYTALCTVLLSCTVAVIFAQSEFSDHDLELHQNGEQLERITRKIHHEPLSRPRPSTFPRPTPTFPRPPRGGRYARSAMIIEDRDGMRERRIEDYSRPTFGRLGRSVLNEETDELQLNSEQFEQLTRNVRSPQWGPPRSSNGPVRIPPSKPFSSSRRFKRSTVAEEDIALESNGEELEELTRNARSPQFGPSRPSNDRRSVQPFPDRSQFPRPNSFPGKFPSVPSSFDGRRRFKRSTLNEEDIALESDGEQFEELTRNARSPQFGPSRPSNDRRLVQPFPDRSQFPRPNSFPGKFPSVPSSFDGRRRFRRATLNEEDIALESDGEQFDRFTRSIQRPGQWDPRPSPTFPRPPINPPRYIRSPSRIYDINMPAPKVVRNFGDKRYGRSVPSEQDDTVEFNGEQLDRFTRSIQRSGPWERPRPSPTFPRPPTRPMY